MAFPLSTSPRRPYLAHLPSHFQNDQHTFRKQELETKKLVMNTLRYDRDAMYYLDIEGQLDEMCFRAGLSLNTFFYLPTHPNLVLDFFASLEFVKEGPKVVGWMFTIQGTRFKMTRDCASYKLGVDHAGSVPEYLEDERNAFWHAISGCNNQDNVFTPNLSPELIKSDVWKYLHQLLAVNINSRGDEGARVTIQDIDLMIALNEGIRIDFFELITQRFKEMRSTKNGSVMLGLSSLITRIAIIEGFDFQPGEGLVDVLDYYRLFKLNLLNIELPHAENDKKGKGKAKGDGSGKDKRKARKGFASLFIG